MLPIGHNATVRYYSINWSRPLGEGGEGLVYLARSVASGTLYAAKFPRTLIPADAVLRIRQELTRVLRVRGDFVARPVGWNFGLKPFVVYEYAEHGCLRDEMNGIFRSNQVYHPDIALLRAHQMLLGICNAHESGVVHRDVKPENFLIYSDGTLKLSDFGLGRTLHRPFSNWTNVFVGTREYAAPEQFAGWELDGRADLFAVGVVLYEMLMGFRPRRDGSSPYPSIRFRNILPGLDRLCARLLSRDRSDRPLNARVALAEVYEVRAAYWKHRQEFQRRGLRSPY